jgi:26S proteasome regulatory subunit N4
LKTDYKELMKAIEKSLHEHYASVRSSEDLKETEPSPTGWHEAIQTQNLNIAKSGLPFARVNSVAPSSPADDAGLKAGDKVVDFGPIHSENHQNLQKIAEVVQRSEGVRQY